MEALKYIHMQCNSIKEKVRKQGQRENKIGKNKLRVGMRLAHRQHTRETNSSPI